MELQPCCSYASLAAGPSAHYSSDSSSEGAMLHIVLLLPTTTALLPLVNHDHIQEVVMHSLMKLMMAGLIMENDFEAYMTWISIKEEDKPI